MSENGTENIDPPPPTNPNIHRQRPTMNRNQTGEADTMERLFHALFFRLAVMYSRAIPKHVRRLGETAILLMSIICLALLVYVHFVFNHRPLTCLSHLRETWPRQGVIRVELFLDAPPEAYDLHQSYLREFYYHFPQVVPEPYKNETVNIEFGVISDSNSSVNAATNMDSNAIVNVSLLLSPEVESSETNLSTIEDQNSSSISQNQTTTLQHYHLLNLHWLKYLLMEEQPILEYSTEYGFLRLSEGTRQRLNIEVLYVQLDINNDTCFGSGLTRFLLDQVIGYQEILMLNIKHLISKENRKGYVRNVLTNDHYRFVDSNETHRLWNYTVALVVMLIFTVSISMLLRYSHYQIFIFIIDLLRIMEQNGSIMFPVAPLLTVILALIGMEAVMSEFFNDTSTAFYVIIVVWIADQYHTVCCHTVNSKKHWVRFFYIYHFAFYIYHARYNGQYSGLALTTSCCFIFHSMLYFFHHIELPVIEAQVFHVLVDRNVIDQPANNIAQTDEEHPS